MRGKASVDSVHHKWFSRIDEGAQFFRPTLCDEISRIEIIRKRDGAQFDSGLPRFRGHVFIYKAERTISSTLTCGIAIEEVDNALGGMLRNESDMLNRKRSAQCGNGVFDAVLMKRDDVRIAFDDDGHTRVGHRFLRLVESV